jgi:hypothetical protein
MAVLLAARPDRERERLHQVEVPRSTYHAVRRRAYEELWLRDRYIPHPVPIGRPYVTFLVVRPFADRAEELMVAMAADEGNSVLWASPSVALAVFFHAKPTDGARWRRRVEEGKYATAPVVVTVRADAPTIPVYFDFEGLWCHLVGLPGTLAYPHGLGGSLPEPSGDDGLALTPHRRWAIGELLRRPFDGADGGRGPHLAGPFGLPFAQRRMLLRGWVDHRTLLDPGPVPPYEGRSAETVALVMGTPKAGARPDALFSVLTRECRVFPFLLVVGEERWILGALGAAAGTSPSARSGPRRPVLPTLRDYLEGIDIVQEPASQLAARVDHRYDRLLPPAAASGAKDGRR